MEQNKNTTTDVTKKPLISLNFIRVAGIFSLISSALAYSLIFFSGYFFIFLPIAWILFVLAALLPKVVFRKAGALRALGFSTGIISIIVITIAGYMIASRTGNCGVYTYSECNTSTSMNVFYIYIFLLALYYICEFYYRTKINNENRTNTATMLNTSQKVASESLGQNIQANNLSFQQPSTTTKLSLQKPTFTWNNLLGLMGTTFLASLFTIVPLYVLLLTANPRKLGFLYLIIMILAIWSIFAQPFVAILLTKRMLKLDATKMIVITAIVFFVFGRFALATNIVMSVLGYLSILFLSYYIQLKLASNKK